MKIKFLTWNTQLYEYGNMNRKPIEIEPEVYNQGKNIIMNHFSDLSDEEKAIAVLQEIPYKIKKNGKWDLHPVFKKFKKDFTDTDYDIIYHDGWHIKMTVVIAPKGTVSECEGKTNLYIPFMINSLQLNVLALHAHNAFEARQWLAEHEDYKPNIMLGDFNAGNYKKSNKDNKIAVNRQNYLLLTEGYIDLCQGLYTTKYRTQIDHILLENIDEFKYKYENVKVNYDVEISDHYPVYGDVLCADVDVL
ncbi:MAG: hypothetical protein GX273_01985 [Bacteroidales bacterium]|nr:hypothetical protein [Bacteroidales bacterium]